MTEAELRQKLDAQLDRIAAQGRCKYVREVWMLCWTHSMREQADRLRIDYVVNLEGRLIGIEAKIMAGQPADLGRHLAQCAQYAAGKIAANRADVPQSWIGKPLDAVFLCTNSKDHRAPHIGDHYHASHRLFGPLNVGYVASEPRKGLVLRLAAERFWTEERGYHAGMMNKGVRVGNSTQQVRE